MKILKSSFLYVKYCSFCVQEADVVDIENREFSNSVLCSDSPKSIEQQLFQKVNLKFKKSNEVKCHISIYSN